MVPSRLPAWRVVVGHVKDGEITHIESVYTREVIPFQQYLGVIRDPRGFHVGTTRNFCLDYYTGMIEPEEGPQGSAGRAGDPAPAPAEGRHGRTLEVAVRH